MAVARAILSTAGCIHATDTEGYSLRMLLLAEVLMLLLWILVDFH